MLLSARLRCDTSHRGDSALGCWCVLEGNSPNPGASTPLRKKIRQIPYVTFVNVERTSGPWPWCPLFFECLKISQTCITWKLSVSLQLWVWNNHHWERVKHGQSFECDKGRLYLLNCYCGWFHFWASRIHLRVQRRCALRIRGQQWQPENYVLRELLSAGDLRSCENHLRESANLCYYSLETRRAWPPSGSLLQTEERKSVPFALRAPFA